MKTEIPFAFFDAHTHPRNLPFSQHVLPHITTNAWGALAMPNTTPRLTRWEIAAGYLNDLERISPTGFVWVGSCYLTDNTDPRNLLSGFEKNVWRAAKLYPAGMTTNSTEAVTSVAKIRPVLEEMARVKMPVLIHGECADARTHPEYAEKRFMDEVLPEICQIGVPIILEHVSDGETAWKIAKGELPNVLGATITPQHLLFDSGAIIQSTRFEPVFKRGVRPSFVCMPPLKMPDHSTRILEAIKEKPECFWAGTDCAPHPKGNKLAEFGACGCFSPRSVELYATAFDEAGILELLPEFLGGKHLRHYGLTPREPNMKLMRTTSSTEPTVGTGEFEVMSFSGGMELPWVCEKI